jgi:hypothetical protein
MKTISLAEAYKVIKKYNLPSAYNSVAFDKLREDEAKLDEKVSLTLKIIAVEKATRIAELKEALVVNQVIIDYYNTSNSNLYYKENITKSDREYIKRQFLVATSERDYLTNILNDVIKETRIEI